MSLSHIHLLIHLDCFYSLEIVSKTEPPLIFTYAHEHTYLSTHVHLNRQKSVGGQGKRRKRERGGQEREEGKREEGGRDLEK